MSVLRLTGGRIYDPANSLDGVVRDLWVMDGRIIADPGAEPPAHEGLGARLLLTATDVVQPRRRRIRLVWRPLVLITVASLLFITAVMIVFAWADRAGSLARADRTSQVLALAFERHIGRTLAELEGSLVMNAASFEHRNAIAEATSSGLPTRPISVLAAASAAASA